MEINNEIKRIQSELGLVSQQEIIPKPNKWNMVFKGAFRQLIFNLISIYDLSNCVSLVNKDFNDLSYKVPELGKLYRMYVSYTDSFVHTNNRIMPIKLILSLDGKFSNFGRGKNVFEDNIKNTRTKKNRCVAITKKGKRCKKYNLVSSRHFIGSRFGYLCHQHAYERVIEKF